ncbi:MAG: amidinotransferase [Flavobacteriales bacterium]|nr:MAG: amidinotransferase [Flavobacteriales bacterium]
MSKQLASDVILIRPVGFGYDPETAATNPFQRQRNDPEVRAAAEREFDGLLSALDNAGIGITVLDPVDPTAPNAVFPNNWFSTHEDGTVVLYPMCTPSRRRERDRMLDESLEALGFRVRRMIDLTTLEADDRFLEGTGSLVIDRMRGVAYAAMGPRTTERAINFWCGALRCGPVPFLATMDGTLTGTPVYHTNVLMSIGEKFAVVCLDAIPYPVERDDVRDELGRGGKEIIAITREQMMGYVANLLQLKNTKGDAFIFLSRTAFNLLKPEQRQALERQGRLVPVDIPTIEEVGGGSVRCMIAENFLPRR